MLDLIIIAAFIYVLYYFITINRYDKNGHAKTKQKVTKSEQEVLDYIKLPTEAKLFINKYKLDISKINIRALLKALGVTIGIDVGITSIVVILLIKNIILELIVGLLLMIILYIISMKILANSLKKRGIINV